MINSYFLLINGEQTGPYTQYDLMDMNLDIRTMVWSPLSNDWQEMIDLPEFSHLLEDKGVYLPTKTNLASFWWRLLAYAIDYIVIIIVAVVMATAYYTIRAFLGHLYSEEEQNEGILNLFGIILMIFYHTIFEASKLRGSIGKIICKLCVVDVDGTQLSFLRAFGRNAGKILSGLIIGLGFLRILWDDSRQGWHDELARAYVIRRKN